MTYKLLFSLFSIFFILQRIAELKLHRQTKVQGEVKAMWLTKALIVVHSSFFLACLGHVYLQEQLDINVIRVVIGFTLFLLGLVLRRWVIRTLGQFWSIDIELREKHPLITTGPYQFCRHPNYVAILLEVVGFCLVAQAFVVLIMTLSIYIPLLFIRIQLEEKELMRVFGQRYEVYKAKVPV